MKHENFSSQTKVPFNVSLIQEAAEAILKQIKECAQEKDAAVQLDKAKAIGLLTESLAKFDFKINL